MSRNKINHFHTFSNSNKTLESQILKNQNKKYFSIFGPDDIINSDIKRNKMLLSKNQNIINNYEKGFIMIEKLNDNKSFFALKRELNNDLKLKNKKKNKLIEDEFSKRYLNLKNFKYLINEQHDKQNDDEKFMFNFMNHLENRKKPKRKIRYSQIFEELVNNSRNKKRKSVLNKLKENQTHSNFLSNTVFSFNSTTAMDTYNNFFNNNNDKENDNKRDKNKYPFFAKKLNKKLFNILNIANTNENLIEKSDKKLKKEIIFNKTENNFFNNIINRNTPKINQEIYYNDKSKFSYPIINKIIYQKMKRTDAFEKAKNMLVDKYLKKKELMNEYFKERERERKEMEEYLKQKEEEEKNKPK